MVCREAETFSRIDVAHLREGTVISWQKCTMNFFSVTGKTAYKPASTPINLNVKFEKAEEDAVVNREMC